MFEDIFGSKVFEEVRFSFLGTSFTTAFSNTNANTIVASDGIIEYKEEQEERMKINRKHQNLMIKMQI